MCLGLLSPLYRKTQVINTSNKVVKTVNIGNKLSGLLDKTPINTLTCVFCQLD